MIPSGVKLSVNDHDETNSQTKPGTLQLCDGHSCLIIELHCRHKDVPLSLLNFLCQPNYTFVGCGIKENFVNLEKHHGIGCRNAVELGPLAATVMKKLRLSYCGVDELAFVVNNLIFESTGLLTLILIGNLFAVMKNLLDLLLLMFTLITKLVARCLKVICIDRLWHVFPSHWFAIYTSNFAHY